MKLFRFKTVLHLCSVSLLAATLLHTPAAHAYSVLSHEEVVDMAWKTQLVPMLRARFPGISDDDLRQAHAYAYGGSVIQDIGYYPFGSHFFSDLLHYVRPNEFVEALLRDSTTPDEYAFALGALAHFCGDTVGHPFVNQVTAAENPSLEHRFGPIVTYAENPTAHLRTEFGFDVVEVAQGHYQQENYRDFIGFQVSKPLLERAFQEIYGIPVSDVIKHEDLAIATYRKAVSSLIPSLTKVAFVSYRKEIEAAAPGTDKRTFLYRLNQTEYNREFGTDYTHLSFGGHIAAFFLRLVPKVGPFKALRVSIPDSQQQAIYLKSVNRTVDQFKLYLAQIHADPAPLPPPDPKDAAAAREAAGKVAKDAAKAEKIASRTDDPAARAEMEKVAANVQQTAVKADQAAARTEAKVAEAKVAEAKIAEAQSSGAQSSGVQSAGAQAGDRAAPAQPGSSQPARSDSGTPPHAPAVAIAAGTPIQPPSTPNLPELDMDTGKPAVAGEYKLADEAYARLLDDLAKAAAPLPSGMPLQGVASAPLMDVHGEPTAPAKVDPALAADIQHFFAHPVPHAGPAESRKEVEKEAARDRQIKADLATLRALEAPAAPTATR